MLVVEMPTDTEADRALLMQVGAKLRQIADAKKLRQGTVAKNAHVDASFVSRLFGEQSRQASLPHVYRVCKVLGVTLDQVLGISPMPEPAALSEDDIAGRLARLEAALGLVGEFQVSEAAADEAAARSIEQDAVVAKRARGAAAQRPTPRRKAK